MGETILQQVIRVPSQGTEIAKLLIGFIVFLVTVGERDCAPQDV